MVSPIKSLAALFKILSVILYSRRPPKATVKMPGLGGKVDVYWDGWGVPHIYANSEDDLNLVFGYVQAMDRLWQMDLARRAAEGNLSEIFGPITLDSDKFHRTIGLARAARKSLEATSPANRRMLQRFSDGVNFYIRQAGSKLPLEHKLLGVSPEVWEPVDTLAVGKLLAWSMSGLADLDIWQLYKAHGQEFLDDVGFFDRPLTHTILPGGQGGASGSSSSPNAADPAVPDSPSPHSWLRLQDSVARRLVGTWQASNNWVLDGSMTSTGNPILANDPHLTNTVPPIWFEAHLVVPGKQNVRGVTLPGVPSIILGRNEKVAWGVTNSMADVADLYYYEFDKDGKRYLCDGNWESVTEVYEKIRVKDGTDCKVLDFKVGITRHGPIIERGGEKCALRWTGHEATQEAEAIVQMDSANNVAQFLQALTHWHVPPQNFVCADADGNIAYVAAGKYPIRSGGIPYLPFNGSKGEGEWVGYLPFDELPHVVNPEWHFVVTANNMPARGFKHYLGYNWMDRFRAQRITDLVKQLAPLSPEETMKMQNDVQSLPAKAFLPYLFSAYDKAKLAGKTSKLVDEAINALRSWDCKMDKDSNAPTILDRWLRELSENVWGRILTEAGVEESSADSMRFEFLEKVLKENNRKWLPDDRDSLVFDSFNRALSDLSKQMGESVTDWRWGKVHKHVIKHAMGGVLPWLNYPEMAASGGRDTVNVAYAYGSFVAGVSWRMIAAMGPGEKSYCIIPGGQNGNRFGKHWADQLPLWAKGKYKEMTMPSSPSKIATFEVHYTFAPFLDETSGLP